MDESLIVTIVVGGVSLLLLYLWVIFGGSYFVRYCLKGVKKKQTEGIPNAGKKIGMFERGIILTFGLLGEFGAISFIFAAKSMARFKKLEDDPQFAEYYLLGTLASLSWALVWAIIAKGLWDYLILPAILEIQL